MNKLNLKNCGLFLVISSITALFSCSFDLFGWGKTPGSGDDVVVRTDYCAEYDIDCDIDEVKEYWQGSVEDLESYPGSPVIYVILNKKSSFDFDKTYSLQDFPELKNFPEIDDSLGRERIPGELGFYDYTQLTMKQVIKQLESRENNDFSELQREISSGMMIDVDKFRRVLCFNFNASYYGEWQDHLTLVREHAISAIKLLGKREDVIYVSPYPYSNERITGYWSEIHNTYVSISGSFDGLSKETEREIKQTYAEIYFKPGVLARTIDTIRINSYLGTYNGNVVVIMGLNGSPVWYFSVAGILFYNWEYVLANSIIIWKEGQFYWLQEAYDLKFVTQEDIRNIAYFYHGGVERN